MCVVLSLICMKKKRKKRNKEMVGRSKGRERKEGQKGEEIET